MNGTGRNDKDASPPADVGGVAGENVTASEGGVDHAAVILAR